jgi:hypothetical protein
MPTLKPAKPAILRVADRPTLLSRESRACSSCGRSWTAIAGATEDDIGAVGIAHAGKLSKEEFDEIVAERSRIWAAVGEVARGAR